MARPKSKIVAKSQDKEIAEELKSNAADFSNLPTYVTIIGTERAKYMVTGKEYPKTHKSIAIKLILSGDAELKKGDK
jgi:hypothetical protein